MQNQKEIGHLFSLGVFLTFSCQCFASNKVHTKITYVYMCVCLPLCVRCLRLIKILFPPIPRPPLEYKHFLERNDPLSVSTPSFACMKPYYM